MRWQRPIRAAELFATPEMQLRYPAELEVRREGFDEGQRHGFDNMDMSPLAERAIASTDAASEVVGWFVDRLSHLGWADRGNGWLTRAGESIHLGVVRDRGESRVASMIQDEPVRSPRFRSSASVPVQSAAQARAIQDSFERAYYSDAPEGATVVTISYGVHVA